MTFIPNHHFYLNLSKIWLFFDKNCKKTAEFRKYVFTKTVYFWILLTKKRAVHPDYILTIIFNEVIHFLLMGYAFMGGAGVVIFRKN